MGDGHRMVGPGLRCTEMEPVLTVPPTPEGFIDPPSIYDRPIQEHGGGKYLRTIYPADGKGGPIKVDIYCVIEAYGIRCPALQHALKKIVACGQRGKGSKIDDIHGVFDAMWRALELEKQRETRFDDDQRMAQERTPATNDKTKGEQA